MCSKLAYVSLFKESIEVERKENKKNPAIVAEKMDNENHYKKGAETFSRLASDGLGFFHIPYTKAAKAPQKVSATSLIKIIDSLSKKCLLKQFQ